VRENNDLAIGFNEYNLAIQPLDIGLMSHSVVLDSPLITMIKVAQSETDTLALFFRTPWGIAYIRRMSH
jgi:hypothetical protein